MQDFHFLFTFFVNIFIINSTQNNKNALYIQSSNLASNEIRHCSVAAVMQLFPFEKCLYIIYNKEVEVSRNFFEDLSLNFAFLFIEKVHKDLSIRNYIIISNDLSYLRGFFGMSCSNVLDRYLIITSLTDNHLANYLFNQKIAFLAFLVINVAGNSIDISQSQSNCDNCGKKNRETSRISYCNFRFMPNVTIRPSLHSFTEILCPVNFCQLRFIRVDYGATKEELYDLSKNGTEIAADSYGGCVLNAFAKFYNINITKEYYVSNYNWYNTVLEMDHGEIDVAFGPTLPAENLVSHLEKGSAYTFEEFIFIDAIHKTRQTLFSFIMPLGTEVWVCFVVIVINYCIFIELLRRLKKKVYTKFNCLHLVAIYFNQYVHLPKKSGIRIVISMWLIYALLMNAFYNCNFVSTIIKIKPDNMLENFYQLQNSHRRLGGPDVAREWFNDSKDAIMIDLYDRYESINPNNISYALYNLTMVVAQTDYVIMKTGMPDFYVLKEKIVSYPLLYYIPKGHPFGSFISEFMENIKAGNVPLPECLPKFKTVPVNEFKAVTMTHLQAAFKILMLCHLVSSIIFFVECFI